MTVRPIDGNVLIERLRNNNIENNCHDYALGYYAFEAATALSTLQDENAEMKKQLNEFSEFLCRMTGGLLSKTNYTAQEMATAAEDYQQKVCGECDLRAENESLRVLVELGNTRAKDYRIMRDRAVKAEEENKKLRAELERMKEIMQYNGIMVIPSKYPGGRSEWNIPKPRGQKED